MPDSVSAIFKITAHNVEYERGHGVTDMCIVIDRDTADVESYDVWFDGFEFFFFLG